MGDIPQYKHSSEDISASNVLFIAKSLALALQQVGSLKPTPDEKTALAISNWLEMYRPQDMDDCMKNFHKEKEELLLEMRNLKSQISVKNEIIEELQRKVSRKTEQLSHTEALLQREIVLRSSLETQKMALMSAVSELKLQKAALERSIVEIGSTHMEINNHASTPKKSSPSESARFNNTGMSASFHGSISSVEKSKLSRTPPSSFRHQVSPNFNSLPRSALASLNVTYLNDINQKQNMDNNANLKEPRCVGFAEEERVIQDLANSFLSQSLIAEPNNRKPKRLKNLFGKLRRSHSGDLEDVGIVGDFQRGGFRATASPRLCWSGSVKYQLKDFKIWNVDDICSWFYDMGLGYIEENARRWLVDGTKNLIECAPADMERELNLKSPLHRKKIVLAVAELSGKETDELMLCAGKLDTAWVIKWLDDIGLSQLKTSFLTERIDGRMLHKLTMDDLAILNVQTLLFVASIRRGIQVMRENKWDDNCLVNRFLPENINEEPVHLWTSNRVMEWLRGVDLSEYAPNLRGAGVHGALMKYEPKFNAELLAQLLCIPQSKTLLRRHLSTRFKELLGRDVIQQKRQAENTLGYVPLTVTSKMKYPKKGQFSLKRRKSNKGPEEWSEFVCPFGPSDDEEPITSKPPIKTKSCLSSNY
ncbi:liprin-beta-2 [Condylostylus longicornis]|uniref:liprin-beta-2 n=1 Tax=Condylostylus longicornis TaxID=2530218 RepID=UPI00244DB9F6|nr:liprin-beta-2 [Condylostylus longicornis]